MIFKPSEERSLEIYNTMKDFISMFYENNDNVLNIIKYVHDLHDKNMKASFFNRKLNITDFVKKITHKDAYLALNGVHITTLPFLFFIDFEYCIKKLGSTPNKEKYTELLVLLENMMKIMYYTEIFEKVKYELNNIEMFGDSTKLVFDNSFCDTYKTVEILYSKLSTYSENYKNILGKLNEV